MKKVSRTGTKVSLNHAFQNKRFVFELWTSDGFVWNICKNNNVMVVKCGYYTRLMILTKFCKVYKDWNCKNGIVNIELECFPFRSTGIFRMMKSWFKLLGTANCILRSRFVNYENTNTTLYFINLFHLKRYMYIVKNCLFFLINLKSILLFHIWYIMSMQFLLKPIPQKFRQCIT